MFEEAFTSLVTSFSFLRLPTFSTSFNISALFFSTSFAAPSIPSIASSILSRQLLISMALSIYLEVLGLVARDVKTWCCLPELWSAQQDCQRKIGKRQNFFQLDKKQAVGKAVHLLVFFGKLAVILESRLYLCTPYSRSWSMHGTRLSPVESCERSVK